MAENGIDISKHYPKKVDQFLGKDVYVVVTTCDGARQACSVFPCSAKKYHWNLYHWNLKDPAAAEGTEEERMEAFRKTFAEISVHANELIKVIRKIHNGEILRTPLPGYDSYLFCFRRWFFRLDCGNKKKSHLDSCFRRNDRLREFSIITKLNPEEP